MLSLLTALVLAAAPLQDTAHVVLVATTDLHGHVTDWDYVADRPFAGGLARVATVVDSLRARFPGQVVVVDAGDLLQGDAFATYFARVAPAEPHPIVEAMNLAGYDAATPGNHDFDWGLPVPPPGRHRRALSVRERQHLRRSRRLAALPALSRRPAAAASASRSPVSRRPARWSGTATSSAGASGSRRSGRPWRRCSRPCGATPTSSWPWPIRDSAAAPRTTRRVWATSTRPPCSRRCRPAPTSSWWATRTGRCATRCIEGVHFVQPAAVRRQRVGGAPGPGARGRRLAAARASARTWSPPARSRRRPLLAQRLASGTGRGPRVGPHGDRARGGSDAGGRRAGGAGSRSSSSCRTSSAGAPARSSRRRRPSTSGRGSMPTRSAWRTCSRSTLREHAARRAAERGPAQGRISNGARATSWWTRSGGSRSTTRCRATTTTWSPARATTIDLRRPVGDRIQGLARARAAGASRPTASPWPINSYRQTGGGGYTMLRGAPVVYDKGERILELLIDAVRARSPLDPARVRGRLELAHRARGGRPRGPRAVRRPGPAAAHGPRATRWCSGCSPPAISTARLLPGAARARRRARQPGRRVRLRPAAARRRRRHAGHAGPGRDPRPRGHGAARPAGYAAAALGDHDFDWSPEVLRQRMERVALPVARGQRGGQRHPAGGPTGSSPYRMLDVAGMTVAVIGYITPETKRHAARRPHPRPPVRRGRAGAARRAGRGGRRGGRRATILLAHAGGSCDSVVCTGEIVRLAEELGRRGVSLIVAGHTHRVITTRVAGIPILETGSGGRMVGVADLVKTPAGGLDIPDRGGRRWTPRARGGDARFRAALDAYARRSDSVHDPAAGRDQAAAGACGRAVSRSAP